MRNHALILSLVLLAMLSFAACGSSSPTQAPGSSAGPTAGTPTDAGSTPGATQPTGGTGGTGSVPDASVLVTAEMAATVLGGGAPTKVDIPGLPVGAGISIASYMSPDGDSFTVYVQAVPGGVTAAEMQAAIAAEGTNGAMVAISGIGDAAGKVVGDHDATLVFVKGNIIVVIGASASAQTGAEIEAKLETLAKEIAGSL
jgi:hypothetical protein